MMATSIFKVYPHHLSLTYWHRAPRSCWGAMHNANVRIGSSLPIHTILLAVGRYVSCESAKSFVLVIFFGSDMPP